MSEAGDSYEQLLAHTDIHETSSITNRALELLGACITSEAALAIASYLRLMAEDARNYCRHDAAEIWEDEARGAEQLAQRLPSIMDTKH